MKKIFVFFLLFFLIGNVYSQKTIRLSRKTDVGYHKYGQRLVDIDPGPSWQGYYTSEGVNGIDINRTWGVLFKDKLFVGAGLGYAYFGDHGLNFYGNAEYLFLSNSLSPLIDFKYGYSHIWNQYDGGTGTAMFEFGLGANFRYSEKKSVYIKIGIHAHQQTLYFPIRFGWRI